MNNFRSIAILFVMTLLSGVVCTESFAEESAPSTGEEMLFDIDVPAPAPAPPPESAAPAPASKEEPEFEIEPEPALKPEAQPATSVVSSEPMTNPTPAAEPKKESVQFNGSAKTILGRSELPTGRGITVSVNRLRLGVEADLTEKVRFTGAMDQELFLGNFLTIPPMRGAMIQRPRQFLDLNDTFESDDDAVYRISAYRAHADYKTDETRVTLGRQRINWQQTRIWNPADVFNQITPLQIEREQRPGIDALSASHDLWSGDISGAIDVVVNPEQGFDHTNIGLRAPMRTAPGDGAWEVAPLYVSLSDRSLWGMEGNGQLGDVGLNFEVVRIDDDFTQSKYTQAAVGTTYAFSNGINIDLEYFYNEGAISNLGLAERMITTRILTGQKHFANARVQYDVDTATEVECVVVYDVEQGSSLINPRAILKLQENVEFLLGAQLFIDGEGEGEYSDFEHLGYTWLLVSF